MNFWETVLYELEYRGIDRKQLALEAGFDVSNISKGAKNGNIPSADTAVRIARVLGTSVEYLVSGATGFAGGAREGRAEESVLSCAVQRLQKYRRLLDAMDALGEHTREAIISLAEALSQERGRL